MQYADQLSPKMDMLGKSMEPNHFILVKNKVTCPYLLILVTPANSRKKSGEKKAGVYIFCFEIIPPPPLS